MKTSAVLEVSIPRCLFTCIKTLVESPPRIGVCCPKPNSPRNSPYILTFRSGFEILKEKKIFQNTFFMLQHLQILITASAAALLVAAVIGYVMCRWRLMPVPALYKAWFLLTLLICGIHCNLTTLILTLLCRVGLISRVTSQGLCAVVCAWGFYYLILTLNPQLRVHISPTTRKLWNSLPHHSCVLVNHTSFFDSILFVGLAPYRYIFNTRTLLKASLLDLPIFGTVFRRVGHFPVYFRSQGESEFAVDKDKQEVVMRRLQSHLDQQGRIAFFPEGSLNKTPDTLKPFRLGMFGVAKANRLPLYYFITKGNNVAWPVDGVIGGAPADIYVHLGEVVGVNYDEMDPPKIAELSRSVMQECVSHVSEGDCATKKNE